MSKEPSTDIALIKQQVEYIRNDVSDIKRKIDYNYVSKEEFEPVKKVVYGLVALLLTTIIGALAALVIKK